MASAKSLPSMALTIPVFLVVRLLVKGLRQIYQAPLTVNWDFVGASATLTHPLTRRWIVNTTLLDSLGKRVPWQQAFDTCGNVIGLGRRGPDAMRACYQANHWIDQIAYQPLERFWLFQGIENAIFLALAAGLVTLTFWWLRKKLS